MFIKEEIIQDKRPFLAVYAPEHKFVEKYLDRQFDRRITDKPEEAEPNSPAIIILDVDKDVDEAFENFKSDCAKHHHPAIVLRVPMVIGTGMTGTPMRLAHGVSRGTLLKIKGNEAAWSMIHATDVAKVADMLVQKEPDNTASIFTISAPPVDVNGFIEALGHRIKDKRVGTIARRWARILYGKEFFDILTNDKLVDTALFNELFPDFVFVNPAEYLTTHVYDNESL